MRRLIPLILLSLLFTGCSTVSDKHKAMTLNTTIRAYESTIRWADFDTASGFIDRDKVEDPGPDPEVLKGIKVTSYQSTIVNVSEDGTEAEVIASIRYYNDRRMSVVDLTDHQVWHYDEELKRWFLEVPLPAFK